MENVKLLLVGVIAGSLMFMSGCATTGFYTSDAGPGFLYHSNKEAVTATSASGDKMGEACSSNILGLFTTGDSSVHAAKKKAGVSKVATVDKSYFRILALYGSSCTIVHGQ